MARTRSFLPPANCGKCNQPPPLGNTLWHSGVVWLCATCLAEATPGSDLVTKSVSKIIEHGETRVRSRRKKIEGELVEAQKLENESDWHGHAVESLQIQGNQRAKNAAYGFGEATTSKGYMRDTLIDSDLVGIESSERRSRMLRDNDIVAIGLDVADTIGASNSMEKLLAHEIALAHKIANEQATKSLYDRDPVIELKRLQIAAKMMNTFQQGVLTLHKLRTGGTQNVIVQHVHVADGGQAVIGSVQTGGKQE